MSAIEKINTLKKNITEIEKLFLYEIPKWEKHPQLYDKTGYGFNDDSRFSACDYVKVAFTSYEGGFGSSSCLTVCSLDYDLFEKHFIKYLNKNKKDIMLEIANQMKEEAKTLKLQAEKELTDKLKELEKLT